LALNILHQPVGLNAFRKQYERIKYITVDGVLGRRL